MLKESTNIKTPEFSLRKRFCVATILLLIFFAFLWANVTSGIPFVPILATFIALCALTELVSICRSRLSSQVVATAILQVLLIICATFAIWVIERYFENWALILLAILVPVFTQNMSAYFIGHFWLPRVRDNSSVFTRLLRWRNFHSSPRKTAGIAIITSFLALIITLPWTINDPLLAPIAVIASLTAAFGDLLESYLKRLVHVQDSGERLRDGRSTFAYLERAVGSHGGFLDRFDSVFFCCAIILPVITISIGGR